MSENSDDKCRDKYFGQSKKTGISLEEVKKSLKESLKKLDNQGENTASPEIALEVFDEKIKNNKLEKQAFIAEHMFRRAIEESIPCGIAAIDNNARQVYVNQYFCEMVGWSDEELLGHEFPYVYWPDDQKNINEAFMTGEIPPQGIEVHFRRKNGTRFWGLVSASVLADSRGNSTGRILSIADIGNRKKSEHDLRILSSKLIGVQEKERKHVSRDLHDSIGGKLTAIKYSLEKIIMDFKDIAGFPVKSLYDILSIVRDTTDEIHRISKNLHPSILDDLGLVSALRGLCREYNEIYSDIQLYCNFDINENNIPDSLMILIYRVMQEALNNVAKHSKADMVNISLKELDEYIELIINDNGKGFDISAISASDPYSERMGINSMKERAELFGGIFEIKSHLNKGTSVRALWPFQV